MTHIWAMSLAGIQAAFVTVAVGDTDPGRSISVTPAPKLAPIQEWCNNQKILSSDYTSFSLFWLSITYFFGLLVVATSYIIEPMYGTLWRCRHYKERQFLEWASDETLQLHRAAHQGIGSGIWQGFTDAVPRNIKDEPLADLALYYTEADHVRTMDDGASDGAIPFRLEGNPSPHAPTVAFSNSLLTSLHMWDPFLDVLRLERPDLRILRYDTRGRHSIPQPPRAATLTTLTADLAQLLDALHIPQLHALVGVSMGGATALSFASNHPTRLLRTAQPQLATSRSGENGPVSLPRQAR
ncbi:3-oxoadipate enol-lactonase I [Ophiocordyceps sinensis CO18]|uniref:3-oxoadipate enol-lactonase I n=1 Tax=Ophiocordyceps sinensis (strain Co18 / CGMCC 3.14243) TaxID=911162 RepID=T5ANE6_OPHSC|nr:3-oxoadipate enol-lactonase I [Ophiocordyceps sinensis CO18]